MKVYELTEDVLRAIELSIEMAHRDLDGSPFAREVLAQGDRGAVALWRCEWSVEAVMRLGECSRAIAERAIRLYPGALRSLVVAWVELDRRERELARAPEDDGGGLGCGTPGCPECSLRLV
jgi:hypothetical protein